MSARAWSSIPAHEARSIDLSRLGGVPERVARRLPGTSAELGEHPEWNERLGGIVWVDITRGLVRLWDGASDRVLAQLDGPVGAALSRADGSLILASAPQIATVEVGAQARFVGPGPAVGMRFNDASIAADGALWVGEMPLVDVPKPRGRLIRIERGGSGDREVVFEEMGCPNGIVWPSGGREVLVCESDSRTIARARIDPVSGRASDWNVAYTFRGADDCVPDGLHLDPDGSLWIAIWGLGAAIRVDAVGTVLELVRVEDEHATSICRAPSGALFVTAASGLFCSDPQ